MLQDIISYSTAQKKKADEFLESTGLIDILREYGEVVIRGSYAYDAMIDPDIDIVVICDDAERYSLAAIQTIMQHQLFQKVEYANFKKFPRRNRPESFLCNFKKVVEDELWEAEVWFYEKDSKELSALRGIDALILSKIDDLARGQILMHKWNRKESGTSKHRVSSWEIIKSTLELE